MSGTLRKGLIRQGGGWTTINNMFIRQGGGWVRAENAYVRQGGAWAKFYQYRFIYNLGLSVYSVQELNLRDYAIAAGWNGVHPITATFTVTGSGWLQAPSVNNHALVVNGYWPEGSSVTINVQPGGVISGYGGAGGTGGRGRAWFVWYYGGRPQYQYNNPVAYAGHGQNGGPAVYINGIVTSVNNTGIIAGGGGGGAGGWAASNQQLDDPEIWAYSNDGAGGGGGGRPFGAGGSGGIGTDWYAQYASGTGANGVNGGNANQWGAGGGGPHAAAPGTGGYWIVGPGGNGGDLGLHGQSHNFEHWNYSSYYLKSGGDRYQQWAAYQGYNELIYGGSPGNYINGVNWVYWINQGDVRGWAGTT